ncbi:MAG: hypothetical protein KDC99_16460 [Cyclobacteriaceae bacterium]|nr:hypothetical protein [Cyclobacteriaceae bacterium]
MTSLEHWENSLRNSSGPIFVKSGLTFSDNLALGGEIEFETVQNQRIGIFFASTKTDGSLSYQDLNGLWVVNMKAKFNSVGSSLAVPIYQSNHFSLHPGIKGSAIFGHLTVTDTAVPGEELNVITTNVGVNPNLSAAFIIINRLSIRTQIGYEFQITGKLKDPSDKKAYLINSGTGNPIVLNGDGLRLGIGIGYSLIKKTS